MKKIQFVVKSPRGSWVFIDPEIVASAKIVGYQVATVGGKLWIIGGDISWQRQLMLANQPKQVSLFRSLVIPEVEQRLSELRQWLTQVASSDLVNVLLCHDGPALQAYGPLEFKLATEK